jgi:hypothetical protein
MKRRDVLKAGATGAASATIGCATTADHHAGHGVGAIDDSAGAEAFLATLDHHLGLTGQARFVDGYVAAVHPDKPRSTATQLLIEDSDELFRKMLRTLFITQSFRDLPVETQLHPAVQDRMAAHLDEIDETVFALTDRLDGMTTEQRRQLRATLRDRPDAAMEIGEVIDQHAAAAGLSRARRKQLRSMMAETAFRLRHEAPGALIDEYTAKVRRMGSQAGASALALDVAQQIGQRAFWHHQQQIAQAAGAPQPPPGSGPPGLQPPGMQPAVGPPPAPAVTAAKPGRTAVRVGAAMMGIGVLAFGAGFVLVATGNDAAVVVGLIFGLTGGALVFAAGFVTLIIGAIIAAASD